MIFGPHSNTVFVSRLRPRLRLLRQGPFQRAASSGLKTKTTVSRITALHTMRIACDVCFVKLRLLFSRTLFDVFNMNSNRKVVLANWHCRRGLPMPILLVSWALAHLAILSAWVWHSLTWRVHQRVRLSNCRHCGTWICGRPRFAVCWSHLFSFVWLQSRCRVAVARWWRW